MVRYQLQCLNVALLVMFINAKAWAAVTLPNIGGGGEDIETTISSKFATGMRILALLIGCGVILAIGIGSLNYTQKRWQQGHGYMIGAVTGAVVGGLTFAIAEWLAGR